MALLLYLNIGHSFPQSERRMVPEYNVSLTIISENKKWPTESLTRKISLSFIPIIFTEKYVMNSLFVAIVSWYALVVRRTVMWSRCGFQGWSNYYHIYVAVCLVTHSGMNPGTVIVTRLSHYGQDQAPNITCKRLSWKGCKFPKIYVF